MRSRDTVGYLGNCSTKKTEKDADTLIVFQAGEQFSDDLSRLDKLSNQQVSKALLLNDFITNLFL